VGGPDVVVEDVTVEVESRQKRKETVTDEVLVFSVRPKASQAGRCSRCRKRCPGYDGGYVM
jgi:transposase